MKKVLLLLLVQFSIFLYQAFGQQEGSLGIVSQIYYDRFLDRTFDLNFQKNGARAAAMGWAYIGIADDPGTLLLNPAGITQLRSFEISAIGRFNFNAREYQEPKYSGTKVISDVTPYFSLSSISMALPISLANRQLVVGLTYRSFDPMNNSIDDTQYYYGGGRISELKHITGGSYTFSPSLAVEIIPNCAIGANYNFLIGESTYNLKLRSPYADQTLYYGFDDKEKYSGSFMDLGLFIAPVKFFSLGVIITPSWKYSIDERSESYTQSDYSTDTGWSYETFTTPEDSLDKFEINIPLSYGVGIAIKPISSIILAFDYRAINWTESDIAVNNNPMRNELVDVKSYHVGLQYLLKSGSWQVPLRLGYYINPTPNKDRWFNNNYEGDQIEYKAFTLGCGIYKGPIELDLAYEHGLKQQSWWRNIGDYFNYRNFVTTDKVNRVTFSLSYSLGF